MFIVNREEKTSNIEMSNDKVNEDFSFGRLEYNERNLLSGLGSEVYKGKFIQINSFPDNGRDVITIRKFTAPIRPWRYPARALHFPRLSVYI